MGMYPNGGGDERKRKTQNAMGCRRWWRLVGPVYGCARMNLSLTTPEICGGCSCFRVICDDRGLVARTAVPRAQESEKRDSN